MIWASFVVGLALIVVGALLGLWLVWKPPKSQAEKKKEELKATLEAIKDEADQTLLRLNTVGTLSGDQQATQATAQTVSDEAKKGLDQLKDLGALIASLPEHLRFPGLLVIIGAALVGVALIQEGGVGLF